MIGKVKINMRMKARVQRYMNFLIRMRKCNFLKIQLFGICAFSVRSLSFTNGKPIVLWINTGNMFFLYLLKEMCSCPKKVNIHTPMSEKGFSFLKYFSKGQLLQSKKNIEVCNIYLFHGCI